MRAFVLTSLFACGIAAAACSATGGNNQFTTTGTNATGTGGAGTGTGGSGGIGGVNFGGGIPTSTGTGASNPGDCSAAAKLVYVLSTDNHIWSFDPGAQDFNDLFTLNCPVPNDGNDWAPNSMAVDRNTVAWVNYVGSGFDPNTFETADLAGLVFKVDILNKTCEPAPAVHLTNSEWYRLGMGFSTDAADSTNETLFVTGTAAPGSASSPGLGKIVNNALVTSPGPFNGDNKLNGQSAELTGTGDAKLFGFFTTSPYVRVGQIDKGTSKILSDDVATGVATPSAWAFSFWGGSFYLYTSDGFSLSTVTKFDPTTKMVDSTYDLTAPMIIVGAGVSTCAPLKPPT